MVIFVLTERIGFRITKLKSNIFKYICKQQGEDCSEVLRYLITNYINDYISKKELMKNDK